MAFQSEVHFGFITGFEGEVIRSGPTRVQSFRLSAQPVIPNKIGLAYTYFSSGSSSDRPPGGQSDKYSATVGGTGAFAGILVNPNNYALYGTTDGGGPLAPSYVLPPYSMAQLLSMGFVVCSFTTAVNYGDPVYFSPDAVGGDIQGGLYNADRGTSGRTLIPNAKILSETFAPAPGRPGLAIVQFT
jgi:hypothetical protein